MRRGGGMRGGAGTSGGLRGSFGGGRIGGHSRGFRTSHRHHIRYNRGHKYGGGYYDRSINSGSSGGLMILGIVFLILIGASTGLLGLLVLLFIVGVIVYIVRENKKSSFSSPPNRNYSSTPSAKQAIQTQYNQRPEAIYCSGCGSGVFQNSEFCTECGIKLK